MNYSLEANELYKNYSTVCENCLTSFNSLFHFYWDVYVTPGIDFCLDVETTVPLSDVSSSSFFLFFSTASILSCYKVEYLS